MSQVFELEEPLAGTGKPSARDTRPGTRPDSRHAGWHNDDLPRPAKRRHVDQHPSREMSLAANNEADFGTDRNILPLNVPPVDSADTPQLNIAADLDALAGVIGLGFGLADWRQVWALRAVSRGFHTAVCCDGVWKRLFGQLRVGKAHTPPAVRSLLQMGRLTHAEQLRRRPELRIGAYFEAFMLGIREPSRAVAEVADLTDLEFHVRLKETAAPADELRKICSWWRGEPARRNRFGADKTLRVLTHDGACGWKTHTCPWEFVSAPPGCDGQHVRTTHPHGFDVLWKVRRHQNWGWLMVSTGALKSSFGFAGDAISTQQESLTEAEERAMEDAAEEPSAK